MADTSGPPRLIRSATGSDLPARLALYQHLIPGDAGPAPDQAPYQAAHQAPHQAMAILTQLAAFPGSAFALIENIVTHARHRAEGDGTALLNAACTAAWQAGCDRVMQLTGSDAPATHAFYQGAGFTALKTG